MMRYATLLCIFASMASAEVSKADKANMFALMEEFGASLLADTTPQFYQDRFHPATTAYFAELEGRAVEDYVQSIYDGTRSYFDTQEFTRFDLREDASVFGSAGDWSWGIVSAERDFFDASLNAYSTECRAMFLFGKEEDWYIWGVETANTYLPKIMPEFQGQSFAEPACDLLIN